MVSGLSPPPPHTQTQKTLWTHSLFFFKRKYCESSNDLVRYTYSTKAVYGRLTWLSVTNSASSPTSSPAWGISLTMRGMKVAWLFLCFRANDASVSSTLASMGFLTGEKNNKVLEVCSLLSTVSTVNAPVELVRDRCFPDQVTTKPRKIWAGCWPTTYCGDHIWIGSSSWHNTGCLALSSSHQTVQLQPVRNYTKKLIVFISINVLPILL